MMPLLSSSFSTKRQISFMDQTCFYCLTVWSRYHMFSTTSFGNISSGNYVQTFICGFHSGILILDLVSVTSLKAQRPNLSAFCTLLFFLNFSTSCLTCSGINSAKGFIFLGYLWVIELILSMFYMDWLPSADFFCLTGILVLLANASF